MTRPIQLYLEAGHHWSDAGAVVETPEGLITESQWARQLRDKLYLTLSQKLIRNPTAAVVLLKDDDQANLAATVRDIKSRLGKDDYLLSLHFNAGPVYATGVEAFVADRVDEQARALARKLVATTASLLKRRARGIKTAQHSARKRLAILETAAKTVLLEVIFITHPKDRVAYLQHQTQLVDALADCLINHIVPKS